MPRKLQENILSTYFSLRLGIVVLSIALPTILFVANPLEIQAWHRTRGEVDLRRLRRMIADDGIRVIRGRTQRPDRRRMLRMPAPSRGLALPPNRVRTGVSPMGTSGSTWHIGLHLLRPAK